MKYVNVGHFIVSKWNVQMFDRSSQGHMSSIFKMQKFSFWPIPCVYLVWLNDSLVWKIKSTGKLSTLVPDIIRWQLLNMSLLKAKIC